MDPLYPSTLRLHSVAERGVPNQERVYVRVSGPIDLKHWCVLLCVGTQPGFGIPLNDNLLWIGDYILPSWPGWIVVYTGPGPAPTLTTIRGSNEPALVVHWGKQMTVFNHPSIIPALVSLQSVEFPPHWTRPIPENATGGGQLQQPAPSEEERPPPPS